MYEKVRGEKKGFKLADTAEKAKNIITVGGMSAASAEGTAHSFSEEEKLAFVDWINFQLAEDADLKKVLPIAEEGDGLFRAVHDGIVLWSVCPAAIKLLIISYIKLSVKFLPYKEIFNCILKRFSVLAVTY